MPTRFYFIHIPKTGGTSLHTILESQVDLADLYPPRRFQKANMPIAHEYTYQVIFPIGFAISWIKNLIRRLR